jgi:uncharacterized protein (TIGR03435 family)
MSNHIDPDRIALTGDPLIVVLMEAFKVKMDQIVGPSWLDSNCFDITAKIPQGATKDQLPMMYQALLAERFKLVAHKELRPPMGYVLVVDKNGPTLKASELTSNVAHSHAGEVTFGSTLGSAGIKGSMTMAVLARIISNRLGSPVQDLTRIDGTYDVDFSWRLDQTLEKVDQFALSRRTHVGSGDEASAPADLSDIFTSIRKSLGLRLEAGKQQVEFIVIDHLERVPTEN